MLPLKDKETSMTALGLKDKASRERLLKRFSKALEKGRTVKQMDKKLRIAVWEMLAEYANGDNEIFEELVLGCIRLNDHIVVCDSDQRYHPVDRQELREGLTYQDAAPQYQAHFKLVVLWLVHRNLEAADDAFSFLWKHFSLVKLRRHFTDKSLEYKTSLIDGGTLASPLCEFILAGIDRHNRGEEDIPLSACQMCGKFMAIERQGRKKYCSKNCGVKDFYAAHGGAAKYMRDLRQNPMYKKKQR
jgi:hypothetical protein